MVCAPLFSSALTTTYIIIIIILFISYIIVHLVDIASVNECLMICEGGGGG